MQVKKINFIEPYLVSFFDLERVSVAQVSLRLCCEATLRSEIALPEAAAAPGNCPP